MKRKHNLLRSTRNRRIFISQVRSKIFIYSSELMTKQTAQLALTQNIIEPRISLPPSLCVGLTWYSGHRAPLCSGLIKFSYWCELHSRMQSHLLRSYIPAKQRQPVQKLISVTKQSSTKLLFGGLTCSVDPQEVVRFPQDQGLDCVIKLNSRETKVGLVGYSSTNKVWLFSERTKTLRESLFPVQLPLMQPINALLLEGNVGIASTGKELYLLRPRNPAHKLEGVEPKRGYCRQECVEGERPLKIVREGVHVYLLYLTNFNQLHYIVLNEQDRPSLPVLNSPDNIELFNLNLDTRVLVIVTTNGDIRIYRLGHKSLVFIRELRVGPNPLMPCSLGVFGNRLLVSYLVRGLGTSTLISNTVLLENYKTGILKIAETQTESENIKFDFTYSANPIHQYKLLHSRFVLAIFNSSKIEVFCYVKEMGKLNSVGKLNLRGSSIPMWLSAHRIISMWNPRSQKSQAVTGPTREFSLRVLTSDNKIFEGKIALKYAL